MVIDGERIVTTRGCGAAVTPGGCPAGPQTLASPPVVGRGTAGPRGGVGRLDGPDHLLGVRGAGGAVLVALAGAVAVGLAPVLGAARAQDGSELGPQLLAAALAAVLVLLVPAVAVVLLREGRVAGAVGLLLGAGVVAVGAVVADLQLFVGGLDADRLELVRPATASPLDPGPGAVAVLLGHVLLVVAGVVAVVSLRRSGVLDDPDADVRGGDGRSGGDGTAAGRSGGAVVAVAGAAAAALAAAQLGPGLRSTDPVLLTPAPVGAPAALAVSAVLVALGVLVVAALASVSASLATAAGALAGAGLGALALALPRVGAGLTAPRVSPGWGAVVASLAALVLAAAAAWAPVAARRRRALAAAPAAPAAAPVLPSVRRATRTAGAVGVLAGVLGVVGAVLPTFSVPAGVVPPDVAAGRVVLVAGVALAAVAAGVLAGGGGPGADLRPALGVLWAGLLVAAGGVGQAVVVGLAAPGVGVGAGPVVVGLAVLLAAVCAGAAGVAGAAERDDVDTSAGPEASTAARGLAGAVTLGAVLLALAPVWTSPTVRAPYLLGGSTTGGGPGLDAWALLTAALAVAAAAWVATASRRRRARALLAGAVVVVVLVLLGWPLGPVGVGQTSPGPGLLGGLLALVGLVGLVVVGGRAEPEPVPDPPRRRGRPARR